jgi:hypothetical protein
VISSGKQTSKNDSTFAALKARLAQGKGKMSPIAASSRANKTPWAKGKAKSAAKGNPTFAVSGATPGVKSPGNKA